MALKPGVEAALLTMGALYLLPISIGLRVPFGPLFLLTIGLAAVAISKVVHLREAVFECGIYPPQLMLVDLAIVLDLLIMFHLLAEPFSLNPTIWSGRPIEWGKQEQSASAFIAGAIVFWFSILLLFAVLIPIWTQVSWEHQKLRRYDLKQYIVGWIIGACLSLVMLAIAIFGGPNRLGSAYVWAGCVSLISVPFLCLEIKAGARFEYRNDNEVKIAYKSP